MNTYWKKNFSWSKSRQGMLETCPLSYYYNYIARFERGPEADSVRPLLKLQKFHFFKGSAIHSVIRAQITQHTMKRPVSLEAAKNFLNFEFEKISKDQKAHISEAKNGFIIDTDY